MEDNQGLVGIVDWVIANNFKVVITGLVIVLVTVVIASLVKLTNATKSKTNKTAIAEQVEEDETEDFAGGKDLFDRSADSDIIYAKTDRYDWNQSETDLDVFVNLKSVKDGNNVRAKDVNVSIKSTSITITVNGVKLIEGDFYAKVLQDDCTWQMDTASNGERVIWLTLYKAVPTVRNRHWTCVLKGDKEIKVSHLGPPVHGVDANDPDAIKKSIQMVRTIQLKCLIGDN